MAGQRTLPGLGLSAYWTPGSNNWEAQHDPDTRLLSILVQCAVKSRVTTLPGSPTNGDVYLMKADASGGNANKIAARDNGVWIYLTANEGFYIHVNDEDAFYKFTGAAWEAQAGSLPSPTGNALKMVRVNAAATGYELVDAVVELPSPTSKAKQILRVNSAANGYELVRAGTTDVRAVTGTTDTAVIDDSANIVTLSNAAAIAETIPPNSSVAFDIGTTITFIQLGAGLVTLVAGAGVTLIPPPGCTLVSGGQYAVMSAVKIGTNVWVCTGQFEEA